MENGWLTIFLGTAVWIATFSTVDGKRRSPPPGTIRLTPEKLKQEPKFQSTPHHRAIGAIPECFDAREKWAQCKSIADIRNQGNCGSCWAVSSASVLSDRICITELAAGKTPSQTYVSAVNLASCSSGRASKPGLDNCEKGGYPASAFRWMVLRGHISGGNYDSHVGCQPYSAPSRTPEETTDVGTFDYAALADLQEGQEVTGQTDEKTKLVPFDCIASCTNPSYTKTLKEDTAYIDGYWVSSLAENGRSQAAIDAQVLRMQQDIMANGPIVAQMNPYENLYDWDRSQGAYRGNATQDKNLTSTVHAVRIIGWCKDKKNVKYWKILNSWGTEKGVSPGEGEMWFEMGRNVAGIEDELAAPIVNLPNSCASVCDARITQILRPSMANLSAPVYIFYDNCVVTAAVSKAGQITLLGQPQPTARAFVGGPAGPIVQWSPEDDYLTGPSGNPSRRLFAIYDATGKIGFCTLVKESGKFDCSVGDMMSKPAQQARAVVGSDQWTFYSNELNRFQTIYTTAKDGKMGSFSIGTRLTEKFTIINTFVNIDGSSLLVCGLDKQEKTACSTMRISTKEVSPTVPLQNVITSCKVK